MTRPDGHPGSGGDTASRCCCCCCSLFALWAVIGPRLFVSSNSVPVKLCGTGHALPGGAPRVRWAMFSSCGESAGLRWKGTLQDG